MLNTRSGAHHLDFSARDSVAVVQAGSVAEPSFQRNGNHLHIFVRMGTEAFFRENLVVIEHAQSSELHAFRVEIIGEAEMVMFMIDIGEWERFSACRMFDRLQLWAVQGE